jgi:serine/threonine-protein kinase
VHEERYQTDALLGRGGMAEVYSGIDGHLRRPVAIKRLREDRALNPTLRARFRREATAAARLNHPGIVAVLDTAEVMPSTGTTPVPIIVMELVDGSSLKELLRAGPRLTPDRALEITDAVLGALTASHTAGIIHRDIKPANVLLTSAGEVKVADFGIARTVSDDSATQTQTQTVMGSPHYMSPEQARGMTVDHRSDLYSVGCLLYELLVGTPPFTGDSPLSITHQHVTEVPVRPSTLDPRLSGDVDTIVLRALEKAPDDRYQTAEQMRADIGLLRSGQPVAPAAPTGRPAHTEATTTVRHEPLNVPARTRRTPGRRRLAGVLAVALLVLIGFAGFGYLRWHSREAPATTEVPAVLGFSQAQAESTLRNAHLVPRIERVSGPSATRNTVVQQSPAGGRQAATDSTVTIRVSTGPVIATVPRGILGLPTAQAERLLEEAGFTRVTTRKADAADAPADTVTAVDPGEGQSASPGSLVTLTITSTTATARPTPASTAGRSSPAHASRTSPAGDGRDPSTAAAEPGRSAAATKAGKAHGTGKEDKTSKAKSGPKKSPPHANKRN